MQITRSARGDYTAQYKGRKASGYTIAEAIVNWFTLWQ